MKGFAVLVLYSPLFGNYSLVVMKHFYERERERKRERESEKESDDNSNFT